MFHIQKDVELCKFIINFSFLLVFDTLAREVAAVTAKRFPSSLSGRESYFETALEMCPLDPNGPTVQLSLIWFSICESRYFLRQVIK